MKTIKYCKVWFKMKQQNRDFDVYCPKIICNITGLNPVTLSRCIQVKLSRTTTSKGNKKPRTNDPEYQEIRNLCYRLIMENWREIQRIITFPSLFLCGMVESPSPLNNFFILTERAFVRFHNRNYFILLLICVFVSHLL